MPSLPHGVLDVITGLLALVAAFFLWRWARSADEPGRSLARVVLGVLAGLVGIGTAFTSHRLSDFFPQTIYVWLRALSIVAAAVLFYSGIMVAAFRRAGAFRPERRKLLKVAGTAAVAAPVCIGATSFIRRDSLQLVEADMRIAGLPPDLDGFRIVQLSDIHLSPLVSEALLARAVDMANEARGSIAVVTGDLITRIGDPLDTCLAQLKRLRADAGVFGCMGNHEIYANAEDYTEHEGRRLGMVFLRGESRLLRFGDAQLNLCGVDHQYRRTGLLVGAESLIRKDAVNVLLSHNPDVFPVAAAKGFDLTLAGHTHGGQISFEMVHPSLNMVRLLTPYVYGKYESGSSLMYVTRGIGMIGLPARLGATPEVSVIRLCAT